jgi:hypothetical protein
LDATGEAAQCAERRQLVVRGDECFDGTVDQVRKVGATSHDALDGLNRERFSGTAPGVNAQMATDLNPVPGSRALRICGQCWPCKPSALGDIFDNGTWNIFRWREAAKNRERLEQAQETQPSLRGAAGPPNPAKFLRTGCKELIQDSGGQRLREFGVSQERGVRIGHRRTRCKKGGILTRPGADGPCLLVVLIAATFRVYPQAWHLFA